MSIETRLAIVKKECLDTFLNKLISEDLLIDYKMDMNEVHAYTTDNSNTILITVDCDTNLTVDIINLLAKYLIEWDDYKKYLAL